MQNRDDRIAQLLFSSVFPLYLNKIERKGRTLAELHQIIEWLTGFDAHRIQIKIAQKENFSDFFKDASLPAESNFINGVICGERIEEIQNPLTQKVRRLDKLVDELAKGKSIEKIIRKSP